MNDTDGIDAPDLIDPDKIPMEGLGAQLAVPGLATLGVKGCYRPATTGWSLLGGEGRAFRTRDIGYAPTQVTH